MAHLVSECDVDRIIAILEELSITQNEASHAVKRGELNDAHINLKATTITLFENIGDNKIFDLETAVRLFLIFFRAAFYLENESGDFAYRYQAIPGQLGNVCFFQLGLSCQDASGYTPAPDAVRECSTAAHQLLSQFAPFIAIQTIQERDAQIATSYPRENLDFTCNSAGYPIVKVRNSSNCKELDFSTPRFFGFGAFKSVIEGSSICNQSHLLRMVDAHMRMEL